MNHLKQSERITLAEGLMLLERHVPTEQAKARLRKAFVRKAFSHEPLFALPYDEVDIDWMTGSVRIPRKKDPFLPTFLRSEFDAYFLEDHIPTEKIDVGASSNSSNSNRKPSRRTVIAACDILKALGHTGLTKLLLEFGVPVEEAGPRNGLMARATSLANYALRDPERVTAEGKPIAEAIVARAMQVFQETGATSSNVSVVERNRFKVTAERDGFYIEPTSTALSPSTPTPSSEKVHPMNKDAGARRTANRKVFLVHGRDDGAKNEVALFLRKIGLEEIILHQRPNRGRHLLTKFTEEAEGANFAVVLITPDDQGGLVGEAPQRRPRQNVVFELGFFIGKLGISHVVALVKARVERPSDFEGICYIAFDAGGEWKRLLARELADAGVPFDPHAVFGA